MLQNPLDFDSLEWSIRFWIINVLEIIVGIFIPEQNVIAVQPRGYII